MVYTWGGGRKGGIFYRNTYTYKRNIIRNNIKRGKKWTKMEKERGAGVEKIDFRRGGGG